MGLAFAAVASVVVIPLLLWGSDRAPGYFGAFTAAIVAAIAVVLGAFYQADLVRRRDEDLRRRSQIAETIDLYFWLGHASREMEFVAGLLEKMHTQLIDGNIAQVRMPVEQFREMVSAHFMEELLSRAQVASRLPFDIASPVSHAFVRHILRSG